MLVQLSVNYPGAQDLGQCRGFVLAPPSALGPAGDALVGAVRRAAEHVVDKWILLRGVPVRQVEVRLPLSFVFLLRARLLTFRLRSQSRTWVIDTDMHARPASGELPRLAYCRFVAAPLDLSSTFALQLSHQGLFVVASARELDGTLSSTASRSSTGERGHDGPRRRSSSARSVRARSVRARWFRTSGLVFSSLCGALVTVDTCTAIFVASCVTERSRERRRTARERGKGGGERETDEEEHRRGVQGAVRKGRRVSLRGRWGGRPRARRALRTPGTCAGGWRGGRRRTRGRRCGRSERGRPA